VATQEDDGLLTAGEIARLSVNASIVILSACNTGAPSGRRGAAGLSGLASGFFPRAGPRAMVVSHWSIASNSTVLLTTELYARLRDGRADTPSEAMRQAMLELYGNPAWVYLSHPAIWGPFSVVGAD
jgi:CHAT domain-containing protein